MADRPTLRNRIIEKLGEILRRLFDHRVPPRSEGNKKVVLVVERQIAVHHRTDRPGFRSLQHHIVLGFDIIIQ